MPLIGFFREDGKTKPLHASASVPKPHATQHGPTKLELPKDKWTIICPRGDVFTAPPPEVDEKNVVFARPLERVKVSQPGGDADGEV